jgi:outer membrane lipoprotein-sorting protein
VQSRFRERNPGLPGVEGTERARTYESLEIGVEFDPAEFTFVPPPRAKRISK